MYFVNHLHDIFTVGKQRNVDVGVAFDMFRTDLRLGKAQKSNTGDSLPGFDFAGESKKWNAHTDAEKAAEFDDWHAFIKAHYDDAVKAFAEGPAACSALARKWEAR